MFQYALYRNLCSRYDDVYYESFYAKPHHDGFVLEKIFNIVKNPVTNINQLQTLSHFQEKTWPYFNPEVLDKTETYFTGNWQNIKYFPPDENALRNDFEFLGELGSKNKEILEEIQESNSVSIHVRRGDFLTDGLAHFFPDWFSYYGLAIDHIKKHTDKRPLKFFVFSDDIEWCKKNFMAPMTYVQNTGFNFWKDLQLMSKCKHDIITNSTFSWWGAWLNKNPDKIVITPKKWFLDGTDSDQIILDEWTKI